IPEILVDDILRVAAQRAPRVQRALTQDLYEHMGSMEIRQEAIERRSKDIHITGIGTRVSLSTWQEFIVFHCRVLITHLVMLSPSTTSTTSSTIRSIQHSSNMMMRRTSSIG
ncbi:hypothetical protein Tco_1231551, partial [Tanacetum coccineum]